MSGILISFYQNARSFGEAPPTVIGQAYGGDVGYRIEQETFDDATHAISATKIRKEMGIF